MAETRKACWPDMHFVEGLTDGDMPRFESEACGSGSDQESRRAMASSAGFFGSYSVDEQERFAGNRLEGATFPNWVGGVRTTQELQLRVEGERMYETFTHPDGKFMRAR
ncbi:lipocalin-like domain-containing protein [Ectopseudomonas hydrolytica]|uniref:Lipocalin-like domain-containing protein n=1 Tax=Ectopseudomonas hydrolytica TaxID=2493633 RepID=A0ABY5A520_9GAMM|nr:MULTISPECIES: lipocalin-like domain-containing protein [Pseudomonas]MDH0099573.1 lipocalin-like domain-containing protein [Pseudomonas sp. GD04158]USR38835.1 lipocalin-like domain-containing protein [Pseudomonas hydrolytica]